MTGKAAVTGMGVICPSGTTLDEFKRNIWGGNISIERVSLPVGNGDFAEAWAGRVKGFKAVDFLEDRVIDGTDLGQQFALVAAELAKRESGIEDFDVRRTALVTGTASGGAVSLQHAQHLLDTEGPAAVPAKTMIRVLPNMAAFQMAVRWGLHGPQITISQACATGVDVVGIASHLIGSDLADAAVAGGYEASNGFDHGYSDEGFVPAMVSAQVSYGMAPAADAIFPSRPFDKARTGVVTGEGAAFLVLENADHASRRGASILAIVEGYASIADAHHPSSPDPTGYWEEEVMRMALDRAGITSDDIDAVIAHGTATRKGDDAEILALNSVFGDRADPVPVMSVKGHMGHPGAASGSIAIITALLAMQEGSIPPTAGTVDVEEAARFDVVVGKPKEAAIRTVLVNAFGFGGQNAAIVLRSPTR